jgi:prepilin-type N-terminal cleavage/methylation domain-containing protein
LSREAKERQRGFTLIEALVALALVLAFAATVVPFLFQARSIMTQANGRVAAHVLLRSLISAPQERVARAGVREGENGGLRWRVVVQPLPLAMLPPKQGFNWVPMRVSTTVSWGSGRQIGAETVRLGRLE